MKPEHRYEVILYWSEPDEAFVAEVQRISTDDLMRAVLSDLERDAELGGLVAKAVGGDAAAIDALRDALPEHKNAIQLLLTDQEGTHRRIAGVLAAWSGIFSEIEPHVTAIIERDHALRALSAPEGIDQAADVEAQGFIRAELAAGGAVKQCIELAHHARPLAAHHRDDDGLLAREVLVKRADGEAGALGDAVGREAGLALARQNPSRGFEERVDRAQGARNRRDRLHRRPDAQRLANGDPTLQAAGAVGGPAYPVLGRHDLVVRGVVGCDGQSLRSAVAAPALRPARIS